MSCSLRRKPDYPCKANANPFWARCRFLASLHLPLNAVNMIPLSFKYKGMPRREPRRPASISYIRRNWRKVHSEGVEETFQPNPIAPPSGGAPTDCQKREGPAQTRRPLSTASHTGQSLQVGRFPQHQEDARQSKSSHRYADHRPDPHRHARCAGLRVLLGDQILLLHFLFCTLG